MTSVLETSSRIVTDTVSLRPSPLALTVLFMLSNGPIHPYEMQRRMKLWGKEQVVNLSQRANLYKTIERLNEAGLIAVSHTERDQRFPERTVYEVTQDGSELARIWLIDMLMTPRNEFPQFPAALSFIMALMPAAALAILEKRADTLREQVAELKRALEPADPAQTPPRVTLLDGEYLHTMASAELRWLDGIVEEMRSGALTWSFDELAEAAKSFM